MLIGVAAAAEPAPHARRGLYAIWAPRGRFDDLDFVTGGQICLQWQNVQPAPDRYDFAALDAALAWYHEANRPTTVQVNGNRKPEWLYDRVPRHPERLSHQITGSKGSLQYWHPAHEQAYLAFVEAYGKHVRQSPYRSAVLGIRLNFNALGTEHMHVKPRDRDRGQWVCPPGVEPGPTWTRAIMEAYKQKVVRAFRRAFAPDVLVLVRNNIVLDASTDPAVMKAIERGELGLFHTSSEVEPRAPSTEKRYRAFLTYGRQGQTAVYAESWADAKGRHGGTTDPRWCSPCQWNYWRLLVDLHCGVSCIGVYGSDLARASDREFRSAFEFAAAHVGYHASPSVAPGAWVALREGRFLKGDYTFLMQRLPGDGSRAVQNAGPDGQRFGAWARVLEAGRTMRFAIDPAFVRSLAAGTAVVEVVYLDKGSGAFLVCLGGGRTVSTPLRDTGRWQTASWKTSGDDLSLNDGAHLAVRTEGGLVLHMVRVSRPR